MLVRKMLDVVFSQHDLAWLDDLLPEKKKKEVKKKDGSRKDQRRMKGGDESDADDVSDNSVTETCPFSHGFPQRFLVCFL